MEDKFFEDEQFLQDYTDEIRTKICTSFRGGSRIF